MNLASPVYYVLLEVVYILPSWRKEDSVLFSFPPSIDSADTKGSSAGRWISPDMRLTIFGLLKSITSSGDCAPDWLKLSSPNRFKNVLPLSVLSLIGVEKLSIWAKKQ